jgi:glycosyltransferase involved in cell wall biosynthesis
VALRGNIDSVSHELLRGWAYDDDDAAAPVTLLITANDVLLARVLADRLRDDLIRAGIGNGRHSFEVKVTGLSPLSRQVIAIRRESDGEELGQSPVILEAANSFDASLQNYCAVVLANTGEPTQINEALAFLAAQTEALLQKRARLRGRHAEREALRQIKWRWLAVGTEAEATPPQPLPPRALVIDEEVPTLARDAGSNAILSHMQSLQRLGFEVTFMAASTQPDRDGTLEASGIACCHSPWHGSVEEVLRREAHSFDVIYLHRASIAWRYLAMARHYQPKARILVSVADLHHLRLARQARVEQRHELVALARYYEAIERQSALIANVVITHSTAEAALLRRMAPQGRVAVVPWAVPPQPTAVPFAERHGLAFIGHFLHAPNLDAAEWLIEEIMPEVRQTLPTLECQLIGSDMPDRLKRPMPGIIAVGQVANLPDVFDRVRLTIAPLTFGAGVKGKVLASLAAGVPCVCTNIAAEGMEWPDVLRQLIADDVAGIARIVVRLHEDAAFNHACSKEGLAYIAAHCSEQRVDALLHDAVGLPAIAS